MTGSNAPKLPVIPDSDDLPSLTPEDNVYDPPPVTPEDKITDDGDASAIKHLPNPMAARLAKLAAHDQKYIAVQP
jgi:hypothetical protein